MQTSRMLLEAGLCLLHKQESSFCPKVGSAGLCCAHDLTTYFTYYSTRLSMIAFGPCIEKHMQMALLKCSAALCLHEQWFPSDTLRFISE